LVTRAPEESEAVLSVAEVVVSGEEEEESLESSEMGF